MLANFHDVNRLVKLAGGVLDDRAAFSHLGEAGRRMIDRQYSLDAVTPNVVQFYEQTAGRCAKEPPLLTARAV